MTQRTHTARSRSRLLALGVPAAAALTLLCTPTSASAQLDDPPFWRSVREPGYARAHHLTRQAFVLIQEVAPSRNPRPRGPHETAALTEAAIERLALAHRLVPEDPQILYLYAVATTLYERPTESGFERRDDEALERFHALRELDPGFEAADVAFRLGVLHTRAQRFSEAADEYQLCIARALTPDLVHWANLAEVTMLAGRLEDAVAFYERAIEVAAETGGDAVLAQWGLAVALDRLGEHSRALELAGTAVGAGGGTMAPLHSPGVFFEPAWEIHWYQGLGHMVMAEHAEDADDRQRQRRQARIEFSRYLSAGGTDSPWAELAQRHVEELAALEGR